MEAFETNSSLTSIINQNNSTSQERGVTEISTTFKEIKGAGVLVPIMSLFNSPNLAFAKLTRSWRVV